MRTFLIMPACLICLVAVNCWSASLALGYAATADQLFEQALNLYQVGAGEQDPALAVKLFRQAKDGGVNEAQYYLGLCYLHGRGVGKNEKQAFYRFHLAAAAGVPKAMTALGDLYRKGIGTRRLRAISA